MALTGDLSETPFTDLVQFYCQRRETVALVVRSSRGEGTFFIQNGDVVDARLGSQRGLDAMSLRLSSARRLDTSVTACSPKAVPAMNASFCATSSCWPMRCPQLAAEARLLPLRLAAGFRDALGLFIRGRRAHDRVLSQSWSSA